jgi:hypothetical protein
VHRLRDLDKRGRSVAALFAVLLCLAPLLAFVWATPDWAPANDPALMAVRALDVGTARTPVSGQPSTSGHQVDDDLLVTHPGPIHFYLLAVPVRVFGAATGMVLVSVLITAVCVLIAAWAAFRQLGPPGGILAALALGTIMFTTGAATLVNPVSSNIARYPVLCSMVLLWCLLCRDMRLLPLCVAVVSFAAQQHLSVLPALGVAVGLTAAVVAWTNWHRWRQVAIWPLHRTNVGRSVLVAGVLWLPVMVQELFGDRGNLSAILQFGGSDSRETVGLASSVRQVVRATGLPPLLGQLRVDGHWLLESPSPGGWAAALLVLGAVAALGWRWRRDEPRRAAMVVMAGILLVAGLVTGSQVPDTLEQSRLALYHWTWPFLFFLVVILGLGLYDLVERTSLASVGVLRPALAGAVALAVAVPALANPSLERPSNRLVEAYSPLRHEDFAQLADQILDHADALGDNTVVAERAADPQGSLLRGLGSGLSLELLERGVDVRFSSWYPQVVHEGRIVHRDDLDSALVLVTDEDGEPFTKDVPGTLVAELRHSTIDNEALASLIRTAESADEVRFSPEFESYVGSLPADRAFFYSNGLSTLPEDPRSILLNPTYLGLLRDYPPEEPQFDPEMVDRLSDSLPEEPRDLSGTLRVYLLDHDEALDYLNPIDIGRQESDGDESP